MGVCDRAGSLAAAAAAVGQVQGHGLGVYLARLGALVPQAHPLALHQDLAWMGQCTKPGSQVGQGSEVVGPTCTRAWVSASVPSEPHIQTQGRALLLLLHEGRRGRLHLALSGQRRSHGRHQRALLVANDMVHGRCKQATGISPDVCLWRHTAAIPVPQRGLQPYFRQSPVPGAGAAAHQS